MDARETINVLVLKRGGGLRNGRGWKLWLYQDFGLGKVLAFAAGVGKGEV